MHGLRLENVTVAGVSGLINLDVAVGQSGAIHVPGSRIPPVADVLVGLEPPRTGAATIDGLPAAREGSARGTPRARLVPSGGGLLPHLSILDNIIYAECVVGRRPNKDPATEIRHSMAVTFGLNDVLDRYPYEVTLGRRRMAGLARALRANPSVIVLEDTADAPTWGALLGADQFRGDAESEPRTAGTPAELLTGFAVVLITCDRARAHGFGQPVRFGDGVGADD